MPHLTDVPIKAAVAQRSASRSENYRCVRSTLGIISQQVRERRQRNGGCGIHEMCGRHGSRPTRNHRLRNTTQSRGSGCGARAATSLEFVILPLLIEPEAHFHFAVHRRRIAEILAGALCLTDAAVELAQAEVAVATSGRMLCKLASASASR